VQLAGCTLARPGRAKMVRFAPSEEQSGKCLPSQLSVGTPGVEGPKFVIARTGYRAARRFEVHGGKSEALQ